MERVSQRRLAASFSYRTIPCFSVGRLYSARKMIPCLRRSVPSLLLVQTMDLRSAAGWDFFVNVSACLVFRNTRSPGSTIP